MQTLPGFRGARQHSSFVSVSKGAHEVPSERNTLLLLSLKRVHGTTAACIQIQRKKPQKCVFQRGRAQPSGSIIRGQLGSIGSIRLEPEILGQRYFSLLISAAQGLAAQVMMYVFTQCIRTRLISGTPSG